MYAMIIKRGDYGKRRLWINFEENSGKKLSDYLSDLGELNQLAYLLALQQVALDQIEPYKNMEEVAKDVRKAYNYYANLSDVLEE